MLDMYANKNKMMDIHNQSMNSINPNQSSGDPLLGAIGSIAGTAVGTAVGGPMGGQIGGALGGQLGGTGTVDPTKLATDMATGAVGGELTSGLTDVIGEGMTAAKLGTDLGSQQTKQLYDQTKEFGAGAFFSKGGPISYAACGGKMKYRNEGSYMPEQPTGEELKALEEQMKKRMMIEQMYENNRRAQEEAGEMMPEMEGYGPLRYYRFEKGGNVSDEMRVVLDNEDLISRMKINQYGPQANMIREQDLYTDEERYGPLKSIKYKSSGGDVYSEEYDTNYKSAQQLRGAQPTKPYMNPEGAREREIAAEQARAGAEAIGSKMPGALGGMSDYLARRRKHMEEMNKLLGK